MTDPHPQHPWAKYYTERGRARPPVAELAQREVQAGNSASSAKAAGGAKPATLSVELAAAVAAVANQASVEQGSLTPFATPVQKELAAREAKRQAHWRFARLALTAAAVAVGLHLVVTRFFCQAPSEDALAAHIQNLPEAVLPLFSSARQPLQADAVQITQADSIDGSHFRYVATVTLRLRAPLYAPAVTNGTATYRRLQEALQRAQAQDLKFKLSDSAELPEAPALPRLLQRMHQAGEKIVVRVPFIARRFGWRWRLEEPQLALRIANRLFEGDSLDRYAGSPYLIFGGPSTLAEIRQRTKLAQNYVLAVTKEVQRHADVEAVADANSIADRPAMVALADMPAQPATEAAREMSLADMPAQPATSAVLADVANIEARPAIDPNAPAVFAATPARFFSAPPHSTSR